MFGYPPGRVWRPRSVFASDTPRLPANPRFLPQPSGSAKEHDDAQAEDDAQQPDDPPMSHRKKRSRANSETGDLSKPSCGGSRCSFAFTSAVMPLAFAQLREDLYLHINGDERQPEEFLLYAWQRKFQPMDQASVHRWLKTCLERAGLPKTIKTHEFRHSAADRMWRVTGDIVKAQMLLRHQSPATTALYLHPQREDLADAMRDVDAARDK